MKKNDFITLEIEDIGVGGEGIGKAEGVTFFVKDAIVGDVIEARITKLKKHYGYARLMKILKPSGKRKEAKCPVARQCGGCQIQEMDYGEQLKFKERKVRNNLERIGGFDRAFLGRVMEPICGMEEPFHYRNKAQYPIGTDREAAQTQKYIAELEADIMPIDNLIGFAESEAGAKVFGGAEAAGQVAAHAKEIKAAGAKYCDCPACVAVAEILEKKGDLLQ